MGFAIRYNITLQVRGAKPDHAKTSHGRYNAGFIHWSVIFRMVS
jgi:hypothetical protein